jgi:GH25 family lysozyme M1 (1,4-beta-N-acetylmuramidase)
MRKLIQYSNHSMFQRMAAIAVALTFAIGAKQAQARLTGVDVYEGNGTINWSSVHSAGISFAFTKATQGNYYEDPNMAANMNNGKTAGLVMGVYDLADPANCSPSTEANYFWNYAKSYILADGATLMPVLDFEPQTLGETTYTGASSWSDWVNQWCTDVQNLAAANGLDVTPIIYISAGYTSTYLTSENNWTYSWIADYNGYSSQTGSPWDGGSYYQPWGSGVWDFWQYTSSGSVSGISGAVDSDVLNGTSLTPYVVTALDTWHGWDNPGGGVPTNGLTFTTAFASCSWTNNRIDIFGIGSDHQLYHTYWDNGSGWLTPWQQLSPPAGVTPAGGPGASANVLAPYRLDDYIVGTDGNCYHQDWQSGWSAWQSLGHPTNTTLVGTPSATSWAPGRVDVYCKGADNAVYRKYWTASSGWVGWIAQGGAIISDPSSVTWGANRLDAYVVGTDDQIWHQYWNGSSFIPSQTSWQEDLPEITTTNGVAVCSWGVGRQDMFVNTGSTIAHNWYNNDWNGNWNETHTPPVTPVGAPAASTWGVDRVDLIILGSDGKCYHTYYGQ